MKLNKLGKLIALVMLTAILTVAFVVTASASVSTTDDIFDLTETSVHYGSCGTVKVAWDAVDGADYYIVYLDGVHHAYTFNTSYIFKNFAIGETHNVEIVARVGSSVAKSGAMTFAAEHAHESVVTAPDCINGGYTTYTCDCGDIYVSDHVDALGHDFTPATCLKQKTCKVCDYKEGALNADNHEQSPEWITLSKPNSAHQSVYPCCGAVHISMELHEWENGVCIECEWECIHEYEDDGDCTTAVLCSNCNIEITPAGVHTPNLDDGDCTTAVHCKVCNTVTTEAKAEHSPEADDGNCTTDVQCTVCGTTVVPGKAHTLEADDGDCTTARSCSDCGTVLVFAKPAHSPAADDGDCTTAIHCKVCNTVTTEAKANHTPEADDGDCTTARNCTACGKVAIGANASHTPVADDGDCTTAVNCSVCDKIATPAKEHAPALDDGDCTTAIHCTACGTVTTEAKADHTPEADDGDCTTARDCTVCGKEAISANASHTPVADDGDCTTAVNCSVCDKIAIPAKNHTPEADDGDCTTAVHCSICGTVTTPAGEHTPEADDGDCTTAIHCTVCNTVTTEAKANHTGGIATCLAQASCEVCGTAYGSLDPTSHEGSVKWTNTATTHSGQFTCCYAIVTIDTNHTWVDSACSACGYTCQHSNKSWTYGDKNHTWTCSICEKSVTSAHDFDSAVTNPTCTEDGYTAYDCICGKEYVGNATAATGHDWSKNDGVCATCQSKCEHPDERVVEGKDSTCTEEGYSSYHHCDLCGADYDKNVIAIKTHSYKLETPNFKDESIEPGTVLRLRMVCGNEGCGEEQFSVPAGIKLTPEQNKLVFKLAVVLIALIIVIWAWRTIRAVPTTTPWFRRRRR